MRTVRLRGGNLKIATARDDLDDGKVHYFLQYVVDRECSGVACIINYAVV